jgi:hypothetical protein
MKGGGDFLRRWAATYAYVGLIALAVFWMMDGITVAGRPPDREPAAGPAPARPTGRVFILLLDSLRYETAIAPELMPHLSRLRSSGVWARVNASYNAITVPCLRAAFTGHDDVSVLGFVQNFLRGDAAIESCFSQFAAAGLRTAAFSDGSFDQFGAAIGPSFTSTLSLHSPGVEDHDDEAVRRALALFHEGTHAMVIVHVRYTDYAAHQYGVGAPGYRRDFQRADRLVALANAAVAPADTLVIMGDHGHSPEGAHTLGQDVPTFALYRGPRFARGHDLGTIPLMSHRWFLSEIFNQPLPATGYMGGRHPAALIDAPGIDGAPGAGTAPAASRAPPLLWIYVALLITLGAGMICPERAPWMSAPGANFAVWLALPPAAAPMPWNAWIGTAAAGAIFVWLLRGQGARGWRVPAVGLAAGLGWHVWGRALAAARNLIHAVTPTQLALGWLAAGAIVVLVANRANRARLVAVVGLAYGFLALPTVHAEGFVAMMVPLLWLWLAAYVASLVREGRLRTRAALGWAAGNLALVFALTQALAGTRAAHFILAGFAPAVPAAPFDRGMLLWFALVWAGLIAKILIFFPAWPRRWAPLLARVAIIGILQQMEWRTWLPDAWGSLALMAALLGGWLAARRRDAELAQAFALGLLFFLFVYCVRPVRETYAYADLMLAGLMCAARWLRRFPQPENAAADGAVLGAVALLAAGFFTVGWSIEKLEWSRIYTWFPAQWVEACAIVLVPWIVAKTALPLVLARRVFGRELGDPAAWPGETLRRLAGLKVLTLLLVLTGLGASGTVSNVYLEGAQELAVLLMLWVGLAG